MSDSGSGMGLLEWILVFLIVGGCFGIGPCADSCYCGGPKLKINVEVTDKPNTK